MDIPWPVVGAVVFWTALLPLARRRFPALGAPAPALVKWTAIGMVVAVVVGMVGVTLAYR